MTKNQIMEEVFSKNPFCSVGDIVLALRTKWHGKAKGSYGDDALSFLKMKKIQFQAKRQEYFDNKRGKEAFGKALKVFENIVAQRLMELNLDGSAKGFAEYIDLIISDKKNNEGNMSNAFQAVGL